MKNFLGIGSVILFVATGCGGSEESPRQITPGAGATGGSSGTGGTGGTAGTGATGGGAMDAGRPVPSPPVAAFVDRMTKEICAALTGCCSTSGLTLAEAECHTALGNHLSEEFAVRETSGGKLYPEAIDECLAQVKLEAEDCGLENFNRLSAGNACLRAFHGDNPRGASCHDNFDCAVADGASAGCVTVVSQVDGGSHPAACYEVRPAREGEACSITAVDKVEYECDRGAGFYCDTSPMTDQGVCKRYRSVGESCLDAQCDTRTSFCNETTCEARRAAGASCEGDFNCPYNGYCDSATRTCVALGRPGDACGQASECTSRVCLRGRCAPTGTWASLLGDKTYCR